MNVAAAPVETPGWMSLVLRLAGVYNLLWGAYAVLFPDHFWALVGMPSPNYPFLWQCIGMIVGVYGIGYWFAAADIPRHWPIILVGFLGKIFGPLGFVQAHFIDGVVPLRFGVTLLTNDLIWWVPFARMLRHAYVVNESRRRAALTDHAPAEPVDAAGALRATRTSGGVTLEEWSRRGPVLLVFLRHLGCTFCRETLADLREQRARIEADGTRIVLVHMNPPEVAAKFFAGYGLGDLEHVSDPEKRLYRAMELARGSIGQLFGPRLWVRGVGAGLLRRHFVGGLAGDGLQMPGAFVLRDGRVVRAFRHADASDRPDYCALAAAR